MKYLYLYPVQTVSAIHSFFLAMTLYPDVQKQAQAELDSVVGTDRLPTLDDRHRLPYLEAVVNEVLRWNPVGPLGMFPKLSVPRVQILWSSYYRLVTQGCTR